MSDVDSDCLARIYSMDGMLGRLMDLISEVPIDELRNDLEEQTGAIMRQLGWVKMYVEDAQ